MADERLSNVIGAPFAEHVLTQLNIRAAHNSTGTPRRTNEDVLFLANKTAWVKLTSSVRVTPSGSQSLTDFYKLLGLGSEYKKDDDLAKNWTLIAGTSQADGASTTMRSGLGMNGSYGLGGIEELGYRPMPGLQSATIETQGTLGSLRQATINFQVWNMNQLNVIEALYFRLGYSMLLEWGHVQFFTNASPGGGNQGGTFTTETYGIDPFESPTKKTFRKEVVQHDISKRARELSGNYDGMLGIVTNFTYSFNQDGGWDCSIRLIGLGAIIDSMRINLSYTMPDVVFQNYQQQRQTLEDVRLQKEAQAALDAKQRERVASGLTEPLPPLPTNIEEIYTKIYKTDLGTSNPPEFFDPFIQRIAISPAYEQQDERNVIKDFYYKAIQGGSAKNTLFIEELNKLRTGLFLNQNVPGRSTTFDLIPASGDVTVSLDPIAISVAVRKTLEQEAIRSPWFNAYPYMTIDLGKALGSTPLSRLYDLVIRDSRGASGTSAFLNVANREVDPEELIYPVIETAGNGWFTKTLATILSVGGVFSDWFNSWAYKDSVNGIPLVISYGAPTKAVASNNTLNKLYVIKFTYQPPTFNQNNKIQEANRLTRREFTIAIDSWVSGGAKVKITSMETTLVDGMTELLITGELENIVVAGKQAPKLTIEFNNTALIKKLLPQTPPQAPPLPATGLAANTGDSGGTENQSATEQVDAAQRFASALHAMLAAVKSTVQVATLGVPANEGVISTSILDLTEKLTQDGLLNGISKVKPANPTSFDLKQYAIRGFNSNLMSDASLISNAAIKVVDFKKLCTAYGIRYVIAGEEKELNFPVYIKFGYLLAFLNNMCLIYDSTQNTDKHPYVYIDFNPETNLCLTNPQQLSVDPFTCMIPFQGSSNDYLSIFPPTIAKTLRDPFGSGKNAVSSRIPSFKTEKNPYQGKTMEILLNVDFLLNTLNQYATNDPEHAVNLKGFLDAIVTGINKSTGGLNFFRVSYRDDSNTVIIKDDQFVPPLAGDPYILNRRGYLTGLNGKPKYGQLPVFGLQSIVRQMEFKTNTSTKMSHKIAISARADAGSANSVDYTPFSHLNVNYVDFYKQKVGDLTSTVSVASTGSNDLDQAQQFNTFVTSIYFGGTEALAPARVGPAVNYYIDRLANVKATNEITYASPFIPANLSITIDGISGIVMGNAFTIPENRLPLSLRGTDGETKVGFIVAGLTHTLENNEWLTKIRGQMIKLRDSTNYGALEAIADIQTSFLTTSGGSGMISSASGCRTAYPESELPLLTSLQVEFISISTAASYLKTRHPDVGKAVLALMLAEAGRSGDSFRSAGGNNFGGVQTDSGRWPGANFSGQFCRRDSGNDLRMFAAFPSPEAFMDFTASRAKAKGFTSSATADDWTVLYINKWWSPSDKASFVKGSATYQNKLSIYKSAAAIYDRS